MGSHTADLQSGQQHNFTREGLDSRPLVEIALELDASIEI